jgi:hypothetical protein
MNDMCGDPYGTQNRPKVKEYLELVEVRVLKPLSSEAVQQSCSTTLLLVFATVDALGKLIHPLANASAGERFRHFLGFLGTEYEKRSKELWKLRNALVHNVINVESYLSSTDLEGWIHLQMIGGSGLIYVNSRLASRDLAEAFGRVKALLTRDKDVAKRATDRLEWVENVQQNVGGQPIPTPPPPVQFIQAKRIKGASRRLTTG